MKIIALSDTHSIHMSVPQKTCDIVIHAGDISDVGHYQGISTFLQWFAQWPAKHKIMIAGNHDWLFEKEKKEAINLLTTHFPEIIYLENEGIILDGISIWGSPIQPKFLHWAFNADSKYRRKIFKRMPEELDILITHCPPYEILDKTIKGVYTGCKELKKQINIKKPKIHIFGHIHEAYGQIVESETRYINASICDEYYRPFNPPVEIKI